MSRSRTNLLIARAAAALGVELTELGSEPSDWLMRLSGHGRSAIISKTRSPFLTQVAQTLANHKHTSRELIAACGVPAVESLLLDERDEPGGPRVREFLRRHGRIVVKPNWGNRAIGVTADLTLLPEVARAIEHARAHDLDEETLLEPWIDGINLRIAVIGGRYAAAVEIRRPRLYGDGVRTIAALIAELDRDPRRGSWQTPALLPFDRIEPDDVLEDALAVRGLARGTVLPAGGELELLGEEAETIDCTDEIHASWIAHAEHACAELGVDVGGVDLRGPAAAFRAPAGRGGAVVLEVNVLPALHLHALPSVGTPRPVFEAFVAYCLSLPGAPAPCAAIGLASSTKL
jgi:D-alanine-D-alanine ligase-like ATP-grasp enzyme